MAHPGRGGGQGQEGGTSQVARGHLSHPCRWTGRPEGVGEIGGGRKGKEGRAGLKGKRKGESTRTRKRDGVRLYEG